MRMSLHGKTSTDHDQATPLNLTSTSPLKQPPRVPNSTLTFPSTGHAMIAASIPTADLLRLTVYALAALLAAALLIIIVVSVWSFVINRKIRNDSRYAFLLEYGNSPVVPSALSNSPIIQLIDSIRRLTGVPNFYSDNIKTHTALDTPPTIDRDNSTIEWGGAMRSEFAVHFLRAALEDRTRSLWGQAKFYWGYHSWKLLTLIVAVFSLQWLWKLWRIAARDDEFMAARLQFQFLWPSEVIRRVLDSVSEPNGTIGVFTYRSPGLIFGMATTIRSETKLTKAILVEPMVVPSVANLTSTWSRFARVDRININAIIDHESQHIIQDEQSDIMTKQRNAASWTKNFFTWLLAESHATFFAAPIAVTVIAILTVELITQFS